MKWYHFKIYFQQQKIGTFWLILQYFILANDRHFFKHFNPFFDWGVQRFGRTA